MNRLRWLIAVPLLLGATMARGSEVRDKAGMFGREAVREAEASLNRAESETNVPVLIETIDSLGGQTIGKASLDRAKSSGIRGVYVLLAKEEHKTEVRDFRNFLGEDRRRAIIDSLTQQFRKGDFDGGLKADVATIIEKVAESGGPPKQPATQARRGRVAVPPPPVGVKRGGGSSGLGVLLVIGLVILAVLIGIRLLGGLFRGAGGYGPGATGRPGLGGPPGYGQPGYGAPGYGGRGGGFFSGLLGGLGGAMAGNWLYDQFRGHPTGGNYSNTGDAGNYGGTEAAPPDAGNDWGGTSGDWGGGDAGGGGDWGGGGGGDWGGGGGGDWGGGGGDGGSW